MNTKDKVLLCHLRNNARTPLTILSRRTKIPVSTLYDRIKLNEKKNIIKKHTTLLNFDKIGFPVRAVLEFDIEHAEIETFCTFLSKHQNVNNAYRINNKYNYLVEGVFEDIKSTDDFLNEVEQKFNVKNKELHFIIDDITIEKFMTNENLLNLLYRAE